MKNSGISRRQFVVTGATALASASLSPSIARALAQSPTSSTPLTAERLSHGWELFQGSLAGAWEALHNDELAVFSPVTLPHCFNAYDACDPDVAYYRGQGWYRKFLTLANPFPNGRTLLHFWGAGQVTTVHIGDTLLATHEGGYDEWVVDITDATAAYKPVPKQNGVPLIICCDNSRRLDTIPSDFSDFSLYGGLYRHVELVYTPATALEQLAIEVTGAETPTPTIQITTQIFSLDPKATATLSLEVRDPSGALIHHQRSTIAIQKTIALPSFSATKPWLWSPAHPNLYTATVTLNLPDGTTHTLSERFGIRHFEFVQHGPFKLNGTRLLLRGTHRHEDHATHAAAIPDNLVRQEMQLIKAMGANFIRLAHYQQSRLVLNLCDELGILVWEEVPWCRGGIGAEHWQQMVHEKLANMINQHRNHPSVILWGLGNEDDWPTEYPSLDPSAIRAFMTTLRDQAHKLDPTRLTSFRRCDFARDIPDVYSPSIWAGWYRGLYTEYEAETKKQAALVPRFIHVEWGADSHAGRHSESPDKATAQIATGTGADERGLDYLPTGGAPRISKDGDSSETYACNLFDWHLKVQDTMPWLTGTAQWVFKDFTTPLRIENPVPRVNQKGLIARDMTLKEAYFVFQSYWATEPMVHIYGHTWPIRWGQPNEQKLIKVYSNCDEVELFHDGKSLGTKRRNSQDFPAAGLRWIIPCTEGTYNFEAVGKQGPTSVRDHISFAYQSRPWGLPAKFTLEAGVRNGNHVTVHARLFDKDGNLCLDARNVVRFSLAGAGRLIDNQGTPWGSRVVQLANGQARISLELTGDCTVAVHATNLPTATLFIAN